jgi:hypothetical protein
VSTRLALALGVAAACLRLPLALTTPFWQDEVASARILSEPTFGGVLRHVVRTESTPPLWYVAGWLVHQAGVPVYDVRLLSVMEDGVLVALVVLLAARLMPLRLAAAAGALVAVGAEFSAEGRWIRSYELFAVLTLALAFALLRGSVAAVALFVAAGSLTHYFFLFVVAAAAAWIIVEGRRRLLLGVGAGLIPFAAWSPWFVAQYDHHRYSWIGPFDWREVVLTPLRLFTPHGSLVLGAATTSICAAGAAMLWRRGPEGRLVALFAFGPLVLAAAVWAGGVHVYADRNLIAVGPFLAVAGVAALPVVVVAGVVTVATASFVVAQFHPGPQYNRLAHALVADGWRPGDAVAIYGSRSEYRSPLEWYLPGRPTLTNLVVGRIDEPVFVVGRTVNRIGVRNLRLEHRLLNGAVVFSTAKETSRS